jgi:hypothetical protein
MREIELHGRTWFLVTRSYPSPPAARAAFDAALGGGLQEHVGVYRHGVAPLPGMEPVPTLVSIVSDERGAVEAVAARTPPGLEYDSSDDVAAALVERRVRVMAEHDPGDKFIVRRPQSRPAYLHADGTYTETPPGQG